MSEKMSTKKKGDLLEEIVETLCQGLDNAKVERNVKVKGKSGTDRQIDVLIQANQNAFDIKIIVEAKNYAEKVGIEKVEALKTKLHDVGGNLGVIVCPLGFTEGAINSAELNDIQLFQVFDNDLGNTSQFIPFRYIVPDIRGTAPVIESRSSAAAPFSLSVNRSDWRFYYKGNIFTLDDLEFFAWNNHMFPHKEGEHTADFGVVKIANADKIDDFYYVEFKLNFLVTADYYMKLFPVSYMKNIKSGKGKHNLFIDAYSKKEDMIAHGWRYFKTEEEMEKTADQYDTSEDARKLRMTHDFTLGH